MLYLWFSKTTDMIILLLSGMSFKSGSKLMDKVVKGLRKQVLVESDRYRNSLAVAKVETLKFLKNP